MAQSQNFENHAKFVPAYHIVAFGILVINLFWRLYSVVHAFSTQSAISLLLAVAFLLIFFYARIFALTVQDRVIRLEMQLRLQQILPPDLRPRIPQFSIAQLIALRFASDQELPALARKVLDENIQDRKAIKKLVQSWQPDLLRA